MALFRPLSRFHGGGGGAMAPRVRPFFINLYGNLQLMKEDITQIPKIPFFLKLKIVLICVWELKVSKNRINYTSLCSCTHHVIKSHGSRDYKSYLQPNEAHPIGPPAPPLPTPL